MKKVTMTGLVNLLLFAALWPGTLMAAPDSLAVAVFCGASSRVDAKYLTAGSRLGAEFGPRGWTLVYGGTPGGLMGAVSNAVKAGGGRVVGVVPDIFSQDADPRLDELVRVSSMAERKGVMQARARAFVILPGGSGTLDELADTLELVKIGALKNKTIILFNQDGYFDGILAFLEHSITEKFSRETLRAQFRVARNVDEILLMLSEISADPAPAAP